MKTEFREELQEALPEGYRAVVTVTDGGDRLMVGVKNPDGDWVKGLHKRVLISPMDYHRVRETRASHIREICAAVVKSQAHTH